MRTSGTYKVYFHELDQPEILIKWGRGDRRKRLSPSDLMVEWDQEIGKNSWQLGSVYLMGRYVHAQSSSTYISVNLYDRDPDTHEFRWADIAPEWAKKLVDQSQPVHRAVAL